MANDTSWTLAWVDRPAEEARIFNPAFCSELIGRAAGGYYRARQEALSVTVAFLVLPLSLHRPTRELLPRKANTSFAGWIAEHGTSLAELPGRVKRLRPISREALLFALSHKLLAIEVGGFIPGAKINRFPSRFDLSTEDVDATRRAAGLLGRWFANQDAQISILKGMGVAP